MKRITSIWSAIFSYIAERRLSRLQRRLTVELAEHDKTSPKYWPLQGHGFGENDWAEGNGESLVQMTEAAR